MTRTKGGIKRKGTEEPNKNKRSKTRKILRADETKPKEEALVRRVTHAVLEELKDRAKSTEATATRRGTLDDNGESDSEITFRDIEVSDEEYASSEIINSDVPVVPKKIKQSINTIYQWTTGFLRFIAVYAEIFPNETPKLLKHAEIVRDIASPGLVTWQTYDKQIRMDRQVRGTSWGKINVEFILQAQRSREENKQAFRSFRPGSGQRFQGRS